eukprot:TRINITY_DN115_c1_g1_i1.p2 TRINITY_DN115_c1_g1~~TRINITY_DN115_c1_g1_i1.p2  ORF type:complete len:259 (+),score=60.78 TRINITY_DN115_c1_g1_i1:54-830(+)
MTSLWKETNVLLRSKRQRKVMFPIPVGGDEMTCIFCLVLFLCAFIGAIIYIGKTVRMSDTGDHAESAHAAAGQRKWKPRVKPSQQTSTVRSQHRFDPRHPMRIGERDLEGQGSGWRRGGSGGEDVPRQRSTISEKDASRRRLRQLSGLTIPGGSHITPQSRELRRLRFRIDALMAELAEQRHALKRQQKGKEEEEEEDDEEREVGAQQAVEVFMPIYADARNIDAALNMLSVMRERMDRSLLEESLDQHGTDCVCSDG